MPLTLYIFNTNLGFINSLINTCFCHSWLILSLYLWWLLLYGSFKFPLRNRTLISGKSEGEEEFKRHHGGGRSGRIWRSFLPPRHLQSRLANLQGHLIFLFSACPNCPQGRLTLSLASPTAPGWGPSGLGHLPSRRQGQSRFGKRSSLPGLDSGVRFS